CDGGRACSGVDGGNLYGGRHNVRILRHRQAKQADGADQHGDEGQHVGEYGSLDEEAGDHGVPPWLTRTAGCVACRATTFWPTCTCCCPSTMTRSSGFRPVSTTTSDPTCGPSVT